MENLKKEKKKVGDLWDLIPQQGLHNLGLAHVRMVAVAQAAVDPGAKGHQDAPVWGQGVKGQRL